MTHKLLESETVLPDDYPVFPMYIYIVDNVFSRFEFPEPSTVGEFKNKTGAKEVRRCALFDHPDARLGDRVE